MSASVHHTRIVLSQPDQAYEPKAMKAARSARFEKSLRKFVDSKGEKWTNNTPRCWAADMVADMKHFCDVHGLNFSEIEQLASTHHRNECDDDDGALRMGVIQSLPPITPH